MQTKKENARGVGDFVAPHGQGSDREPDKPTWLHAREGLFLVVSADTFTDTNTASLASLLKLATELGPHTTPELGADGNFGEGDLHVAWKAPGVAHCCLRFFIVPLENFL